jgi:hypothetical protein
LLEVFLPPLAEINSLILFFFMRFLLHMLNLHIDIIITKGKLLYSRLQVGYEKGANNNNKKNAFSPTFRNQSFSVYQHKYTMRT